MCLNFFTAVYVRVRVGELTRQNRASDKQNLERFMRT